MSDFLDLRPTGSTSGAIEESLGRIAHARAEAESRADAARLAREGQLLDGSTASIKKADEALADATLAIERLNVLEPTVSALLQPALDAERLADLEKEFADAEKAVEEHIKRWNREVPKLTAPLRALMTERQAIIGRVRAVTALTQNHLPVDLQSMIETAGDAKRLPETETQHHERTQAEWVARKAKDDEELERRREYLAWGVQEARIAGAAYRAEQERRMGYHVGLVQTRR